MNLTKKLALAAIAFGVSGAALAGTYTPACTSHAVTIPCEDSAWDLGFEVFWSEATASDQLYAYRTNKAETVLNYANVSPDYQFGFELSASLHFGTGNDFTVRWVRIHDDNDDSIIVAKDPNGDNGTVLNGWDLPPFNTNANDWFPSTNSTNLEGSIEGTHAYKFDAVSAEFGQHIDVGNDFDLRVHGGLHYARIDYVKGLRFIRDETVSVTPDLHDLSYEFDSQVDAVGARVGADGAYYLGSGFSILSHAAVALLLGDIDSQIRLAKRAHTTGALIGTAEINFATSSVVIPAANLKTAINYGSDLFDGHVTVETGWRWDGYYQSLRFVPLPGANLENFTNSGPYFAIYYVS